MRPVRKRKFIGTTDSKHELPLAARRSPRATNVFNRQFNPMNSDLAYVSDITYIRTGARWLYLATILDLYARKAKSGTTESLSRRRAIVFQADKRWD